MTNTTIGVILAIVVILGYCESQSRNEASAKAPRMQSLWLATPGGATNLGFKRNQAECAAEAYVLTQQTGYNAFCTTL